MKIEILQPYLDSKTHKLVQAGEIVEETEDRAKLLIRRGFAEEVQVTTKRKSRKTKVEA